MHNVNLVELTCKNCGGKMTHKDNRIECPYCGSMYLSFFDGEINADLLAIDLDDLNDKINKNLKLYFVSSGYDIKKADVKDIIQTNRQNLAIEYLRNGNFDTAMEYVSGQHTDVAERIRFLASNKCKDESELQILIYDRESLESSIPQTLVNSSVYGSFYQHFYEYCKNVTSIKKDCLDIERELSLLDNQPKDVREASMEDVNYVLRCKAENLARHFPMVPYVWLTHRHFDDSAIRKMLVSCANVLLSENFFMRCMNHAHLSQEDKLDLSKELLTRYPCLAGTYVDTICKQVHFSKEFVDLFLSSKAQLPEHFFVNSIAANYRDPDYFLSLIREFTKSTSDGSESDVSSVFQYLSKSFWKNADGKSRDCRNLAAKELMSRYPEFRMYGGYWGIDQGKAHTARKVNIVFFFVYLFIFLFLKLESQGIFWKLGDLVCLLLDLLSLLCRLCLLASPIMLIITAICSEIIILTSIENRKERRSYPRIIKWRKPAYVYASVFACFVPLLNLVFVIFSFFLS